MKNFLKSILSKIKEYEMNHQQRIKERNYNSVGNEREIEIIQQDLYSLLNINEEVFTKEPWTSKNNSARKSGGPSNAKQAVAPISYDTDLTQNNWLINESQNSVHKKGDAVIETRKIEVDSIKGNTFVNQYLILKNLGKGSYGTVKLALNTEDNGLYAIKLVSKKKMRQLRFAGSRAAFASGKGKKNYASESMEEIMKEIVVMKKLEHVNVVRLFEVIDDPGDDKLLMVMEYVDGGPLTRGKSPEEVEKVSEEMARRNFRDIIKGLEYLHFNNTIHRDLKPENLLMTGGGRVKISDFGTACYREDGDDMMDDTCGTRLFFAPEMCSETGERYSGKAADIYALGVCLYMIIFGRVPFYADNLYELFKTIRTKPVTFPDDIFVTDKLKDLLLRILEKDPKKRATLAEIMQHDWVTCQGTLGSIHTSCAKDICQIEIKDEESLSALTPSISHVFGQLPNKEEITYREGEYIIKEGEHCKGLYLIKEGLCMATNHPGFSAMKREISCDIDFATNIDYGSSDSEELSDIEEDQSQASPYKYGESVLVNEVKRIGSLGKRQVKRGVFRRSTKMHNQMKQLVMKSFNDKLVSSYHKTASPKTINGSVPRGPGCVLGVLSPPFVCTETVQALETTKVVFISNDTLSKFFEGPDAQLQVRLLLAKLQKVSLLRETIEKFAEIHSDFINMEKIRATTRNI